MPDMGRGIIAPANSDNIGTGASEMRTLASTAATALDALEASVGVALDGKARKEPIDLADQNLNDVLDDGPYIQTSSSVASAALNYPPNSNDLYTAGFLDVTSRPGDYLVRQEYTSFNGVDKFWRARYAGTWNAWERAKRASEPSGGGGGTQSTGLREMKGVYPEAIIVGSQVGIGLSRVGSLVQLYVYGLRVPKADQSGGVNGSHHHFSPLLPVGFRPLAGTLLMVPILQGNTSAVRFRVTSSGQFSVYDHDGVTTLFGSVTYSTGDPWPLTLPGDPA